MAAPNAFTAARPKRAGDDFVRSHFHQDEPSSKKPRFDPRFPSTLAPDAPDEDPVLEIDEIGKGGRIKRNAVNIDGYDSDSSTENFQVRADAKAAAPAQDADEDEDMFAEDDNDTKGNGEAGPGRKKKDVQFLDVHEIEGQEDASTSGGHVAAVHPTLNMGNDSSSDSGDDEERDRLDSDLDEEVGAGGKKKHAPKLDAFNMKAEAEEGRFDEHGNYVRKAADPYAVHDSWLEGLSKKDIKRAREAQAKRDEEQRQRDLADDAISTSDVLSTLISHMEKSETVLESLQRLGKSIVKKAAPRGQRARARGGGRTQNEAAQALDPAEAAAEARRKESIEAITEAAAQLMARGQPDIYDAERELLMRQFKNETGEEWKDPAPAVPADGESHAVQQWQYRWADGREGGMEYGPYDGPAMAAWASEGYFVENVEFRKVGDRDWTRVADFS